jgi:hypothetical protein
MSSYQSWVLQVFSTWQDGACTECTCRLAVNSSTAGPYVDCQTQTCDDVTAYQLEGGEQYVWKEERIEGVCCPRFQRTACRADSRVHQVSKHFHISFVTEKEKKMLKYLLKISRGDKFLSRKLWLWYNVPACKYKICRVQYLP